MPDIASDLVDGVRVLTLDRPKALNALTLPLLDELLGGLDAAEAAREPVVLTGAGRAFCAGADLSALPDVPLDGRSLGSVVAEEMATHFNEVPRRIATLEVPVVAAVNGVTAGGGLGLALAPDVALAASSATFHNVFAQQLGLVPDMGASWLVPRSVGRARALAWALLGDEIDAATAEGWGLVHAVVADDVLLERAVEVASRLGRLPTATLVAVRRTVEAATADFATGLRREWEVQAELIDRGHLLEGVDAFFAERRPTF